MPVLSVAVDERITLMGQVSRAGKREFRKDSVRFGKDNRPPGNTILLKLPDQFSLHGPVLAGLKIVLFKYRNIAL